VEQIEPGLEQFEPRYLGWPGVGSSIVAADARRRGVRARDLLGFKLELALTGRQAKA
jgi:hypothetical protein